MSGVFKSYDIRGTYPSEINYSFFYDLGKAIAALGFKDIAVGRDARLSSNSLFNSFSKGLVDSGVNVINLGVLTSPMVSFYCVANKTNGCMITASHNPKEYNGIKFIDEKGLQLGYDLFTHKIESLMAKSGKMDKNVLVKKGRITNFNFLDYYVKYLQSKFKSKFPKKLKVVFDCSNGVGGIPLESLESLRADKFESIIINQEPNGYFPNHECDQTNPKNLKQLQKEVLKQKADLGIMFDGDADRCAFVDEKGNIVPLDMAFLVLALWEIKNSKINNPKVLFDLRFSRSVSEVLKKNGALPVMMRVGNPFHKAALHKDHRAIMAGELSGHIMYNENNGIDDPLFASLKMISLLSNSKKSLSNIVKQYIKYYSSGEISMSVRFPEKILKEISGKYKNEMEEHLDGISVYRKDVWFNIRPSNTTESLIRFEIEGINKSKVEKQKKELVNTIKKNDRI